MDKSSLAGLSWVSLVGEAFPHFLMVHDLTEKTEAPFFAGVLFYLSKWVSLQCPQNPLVFSQSEVQTSNVSGKVTDCLRSLLVLQRGIIATHGDFLLRLSDLGCLRQPHRRWHPVWSPRSKGHGGMAVAVYY